MILDDHEARQLTDIELLKNAAKAAGLIIRFIDTYDNLMHNARPCAYLCKPNHHSDLSRRFTDWSIRWNPLGDDGDVLRLAVKLEIEVRVHNGKSHAGKQGRFWFTECWFPDGDMFAATRRAIVRAAASIGEGVMT